ncbi:MAG TPA: hypothetical protein VFK03_01735 [Candidatus Saccharimonadales bacterium]|nr:hypothetical protein [Candidatus Saccharimonadales bacterium]
MRRRFYNKRTALTVGLIAGLGLSLGSAQAFDSRLYRPLRRFNRTPINQTVKAQDNPAKPQLQSSPVTTKRVSLHTDNSKTEATAIINGRRLELKSPQVIHRQIKDQDGTATVDISFRQSGDVSSGTRTSQTSIDINSNSSISADASVSRNQTRGSP